jgi:hypothetical protein
MKTLAALAALCLVTHGLLTQAASAETADCRRLAEPTARLTCYDRINPPFLDYPIPVHRRSDYIPRTRPEATPRSAAVSKSGDDPAKDKIRGMCRGC